MPGLQATDEAAPQNERPHGSCAMAMLTVQPVGMEDLCAQYGSRSSRMNRASDVFGTLPAWASTNSDHPCSLFRVRSIRNDQSELFSDHLALPGGHPTRLSDERDAQNELRDALTGVRVGLFRPNAFQGGHLVRLLDDPGTLFDGLHRLRSRQAPISDSLTVLSRSFAAFESLVYCPEIALPFCRTMSFSFHGRC
jgi:hypothetical protein